MGQNLLKLLSCRGITESNVTENNWQEENAFRDEAILQQEDENKD